MQCTVYTMHPVNDAVPIVHIICIPMNRSQPRAIKWIAFQTQTRTVCRLPNIKCGKDYKFVHFVLQIHFSHAERSSIQGSTVCCLDMAGFLFDCEYCFFFVSYYFCFAFINTPYNDWIRTVITRIYVSLWSLSFYVTIIFNCFEDDAAVVQHFIIIFFLIFQESSVSQSSCSLSIVKTKYMNDFIIITYIENLARNL